MSESESFYGWKLLASVWLIYFLNMGFALYGANVINVAMLKDIPMDRTTFGLAYTLLNFFIGFPSLIHAAAVNRWGLKTTFAIGSGLMILGSLWMYFIASQPWHYIVGFGVLIGTGLGFGTIICLSTAITRWFIQYRGRAMAIGFTASGLAGFISAPFMNEIITSFDNNWRIGWIIILIAVAISAAVAYLFVKEYPSDLGQVPDGNLSKTKKTNSKLSTTYDWGTKEAYKTTAFWMIFIGACACQYPFWFFTAHWVMHLKGLGISQEIYAFALGLFTMGSIFGRLIGGWLMDMISARFAFILGLSCYFIGSLLAISLSKDSLTMVYLAGILYGCAFGWSWVCLNTTTGNFFGIRSFAKLNGTVLMISALICSPAAIIGGILFDIYQSYTEAFLLNIVIALIGIIALFFAKMPTPSKQ